MKRTNLPTLNEASGVAASITRPDTLWVIVDTGGPATVFGLNHAGDVTDTVRLTGVRASDVEEVAVGACGDASCVYAADIGDNDARRKDVAIYRFTEPAAGVREVHAERFRATYPDGPHDAESFFVTPSGQMFIVTKGPGPVALYRFPPSPTPDQVARLERVGPSHDVDARARLTGAAASPDGRWVVVRTHHTLTFYRMPEFIAGTWREVGSVDVTPLKEPQGEGVAFGAGQAMFLVSEGGEKSRPGVLNQLTCTLQP